jgi:hypothetical protein
MLGTLLAPQAILPRTRTDRIYFGTAFFDLLQAYRRGQRRGLLLGYWLRRGLVATLQAADTASAPDGHLDLLAPFAAIYDFFDSAPRRRP